MSGALEFPASGRLGRALLAGRPLVLGAAIGTRLIGRGLDLERDDPSLWTLSRPEVVLELHREDVRAGADALLTNTFGASRDWLARFGLSAEIATIHRRAVALAREATGPDRLVLGSIGPIVGIGAHTAYAERATLLIESGVDAIVLETHRLDQAEIGLKAITRTATLPIFASLFDWPDPVEEGARRLLEMGASGLGANCGPEPAAVLRAVEALAFRGIVPWLACPSAGMPGGKIASPADFRRLASRLAHLGVRLIGGCCGTTETHVGAIRDGISKAIRGEG